MNIENVFKHNEEWIAEKLAVDKEYFHNLAKGQSPEVLYIGCSDSRATAEELLGAKPGEVFVHRNVANLVIDIDLNIMSVLTYGITHLKVKHIIVSGHYFCGGIQAAMEPRDLGLLNPWLRNVRDVYRMYADELNAIEDDVARNKRLVELNVLEQCINVTKTAAFQIARNEYGIQLHSWVFDIESGRIIDLNFDVDKEMDEIKSIYDLNTFNSESKE